MVTAKTWAEQAFRECLNVTEVRKVDYKAQQYNLSDLRHKSLFVKDILCMANAPVGDGYILLGVKSEKGKPRKVCGIDSHQDSSDLEQVVAGVIEEPIHFDYYSLTNEGHTCGLIHIPASKARPHWPKKDFGVLKKHVFYTRRASGNREASFAEIREMFLSAARVSEVVERKVKSSRHLADELADFSLDERKQAMYKMLKNITHKVHLSEYRSVTSSFFDSREQQCALVRSSKRDLVSELAIFMYPWNAKADDIRWARSRAVDYSLRSRASKVAPQLRKRLSESSLIHVAYKRIYTNALQKWPYLNLRYWFANEWSERWGRVIRWEDKSSPRGQIKKAKYEYFLSDVTSQVGLKEKLELLLAWIDNNVK